MSCFCYSSLTINYTWESQRGRHKCLVMLWTLPSRVSFKYYNRSHFNACNKSHHHRSFIFAILFVLNKQSVACQKMCKWGLGWVKDSFFYYINEKKLGHQSRLFVISDGLTQNFYMYMTDFKESVDDRLP